MKRTLNAHALGQMYILANIIADNVLLIENVKFREKKNRTCINNTFTDLSRQLLNADGIDSAYTKFDQLESIFADLKPKEVIYTCSVALTVFMNKYYFNNSIYNKFKRILDLSETFRQSTDFDFAEFGKILSKITKDCELS